MTGMVTRIIRYDANDPGKFYRGFGYFFVRDSQGLDRFAHANELLGIKFTDLQNGSLVDFEPRDGGPSGNGLRAVQVKVLA